jgi:hypothetical protein
LIPATVSSANTPVDNNAKAAANNTDSKGMPNALTAESLFSGPRCPDTKESLIDILPSIHPLASRTLTYEQ